MRKVLTALAMIAASVFLAAPAIAQDDGTGSTEPPTLNESTEATTPPPAEEPPATENPLTPPDSEDPESSAEEPAEGGVGTLSHTPDHERNITICHRTNSENNPYNEITVSANSIVKNNGHDSHNGPVFEPGMKDLGIEWGDIIPEFDYDNGQEHYDGQNMGDGSDILANGCLVPGEEPPGEDDDDGGDDDGDGDESDGDDDKEGSLPNTGGDSPWILLTGGLLTVLGIAMLNSNGSMSGMHVAARGRHVKI